MACYYIIFHAIAILFFFVLTPAEYFPPAIMLYWIMGSIVVYLDFGKAVLGVSLTGLAGLIAIKFYVSPEALTIVKVNDALVFYTLIVYIVFYIYMITRLARDEERSLSATNRHIEYERSKLSSLINSMEESVILCNSELEITVSNRSTNVLLRTENVVGQNIDDILHLWDKNGKPRTIAEYCNPDNDELQSVREYMHYFSPKDHTGLTIFTKIVKLSKTNKQHRNYMIVLRAASNTKNPTLSRDDYATVIPASLTNKQATRGAELNLAQLQSAKKEYENLGDALLASTDSTAKIIDIAERLLSIAHKDTYSNTLEVRSVNIGHIVDTLYRASLPEAAQRSIALKIYVDENTPDVETNRTQLVEILQNIMSNALKYTHKGYVELRVDSSDAKNVTVSIHDTGIGISNKDLPHVFERSWRSEDYRARESGGIGLGLYAAKKFADDMGVTIRVHSEFSKGTSFSVIVPIKFKAPKTED